MIFVPLYIIGILCDEKPVVRPPPWIQTRTGNKDSFDILNGLKIFKYKHCSFCTGIYIPLFRWGQHGPNKVGWNEPFEKISDARSIGGSHLFALAYWIL